MSRFIRRLFGIDVSRGSLTFLPDGRMVVGFPPDATQETVARVRDALAEWAHDESKRIAVFPWPVDVSDLRK